MSSADIFEAYYRVILSLYSLANPICCLLCMSSYAGQPSHTLQTRQPSRPPPRPLFDSGGARIIKGVPLKFLKFFNS